MPYLVASAAIVVARVVGGRSARRRDPIRGPSRRRGGLGLSAASSGASVRFPSRRAAACGGRDAARAAGTRWRRLSGFGSLWRRGAHGPPAACRHAVSRAFDRCRWLRTSTRRVRRRGRRGQRSVIDRGRRLVPVMLAINATAPAARLRRRGVVRGRGTRPLNRQNGSHSSSGVRQSQPPRGARQTAWRDGRRRFVTPSPRLRNFTPRRDAEAAAPAWWV